METITFKENMNKYEIGWIGLRVERLGRSAKLLRRMGFVKTTPSVDRNGFNWLQITGTKDQFDAMFWTPLAKAGLKAVAVWYTDAQHDQNAAVTDLQWRARQRIGP